MPSNSIYDGDLRCRLFEGAQQRISATPVSCPGNALLRLLPETRMENLLAD